MTARLASELPLLRLASLEGRLSISQAGAAFEASGRQIVLRTEDGVAIEPTDFSVHWEPPSPRREGRAEFSAAALRLEPLVQLAEFLPLPAAARAHIAAVQPRGTVRDLKLAWSGDGERTESLRRARALRRPRRAAPGSASPDSPD